MTQLMNIPTSEISAQAQGALRKVDHESEKFKELCTSIAQKGIFNPITVRKLGDGGYELVDGLHRYTAACIAALGEVPCHVLDIGEEDVLEIQMEANLHVIETKPMEYTRALQRVMLAHPERSIDDQAKRLGKSTGWLRDRLSLNVFEGRAAEEIEAGNLSLANAYALAKIAKLDPDAADDMLQQALDMPPHEFVPEAGARLASIQAALKAGKPATSAAQSGPAVKLRKLGDIKTEYQRAQQTASTVNRDDPIAVARAQAYLDALKFVLSQDEGNKAAWQKSQDEKKAEKARRDAEKEQQKALKAKEEGKFSVADLVPGLKKELAKEAAAE